MNIHKNVVSDLAGICEKYVPYAEMKLSELKLNFDIQYDLYEMRHDKIKELKEFAIENGTTFNNIVDLVIYNKKLDDTFAEISVNVISLQNKVDLTDLKVPTEYKEVLETIFENELALKVNMLNFQIMIQMMEKLIIEVQFEKLKNKYQKHVAKHAKLLKVLESLDDKFNYGKIKYGILFKGLKDGNVQEEIQFLENMLHTSFRVYIKKYKIFFKILDSVSNIYVPPLNNSLGPDSVAETNPDILKYREELKRMAEMTDKDGCTILDYEKVLAQSDLNFRCYIWKYAKFDVDHEIFEPIYTFCQNDDFAKIYIQYHIYLSKLLANITSKSFEWNLAMSFMLLPNTKDDIKIREVKMFFKNLNEDPMMDEISIIDNSFFNSYWINPKTLLWYTIMSGEKNDDCYSHLKNRITRLFLDHTHLLSNYDIYYNKFIKLLVGDVASCFNYTE